MQSKQDRDPNPVMFRDSKLIEVKWLTQGQMVLSGTTKSRTQALLLSLWWRLFVLSTNLVIPITLLSLSSKKMFKCIIK